MMPYSLVDITYVTEQSVSFHLKPEYKDISALMIEKGLLTCLAVVWRHNLEDDLKFEQGNECGISDVGRSSKYANMFLASESIRISALNSSVSRH